MIVERTLDVGECLVILNDRDIFDSISEDGATFDHLKVDVLNDIWLRIGFEGQTIGVVQFKHVFKNCFESHIHILPDYRKEHSFNAGNKILEWCSEYIPGSTLYATVPEFCENVKKYLIKFDFEVTGKIPKAWTKNGKLHDMNILSRGV